MTTDTASPLTRPIEIPTDELIRSLESMDTPWARDFLSRFLALTEASRPVDDGRPAQLLQATG